MYKVINMSCMFTECSSLEELNISNFNTNNVTDMSYMFGQCKDELHLKIRSQYKNFHEIDFDNYNDDGYYQDNFIQDEIDKFN